MSLSSALTPALPGLVAPPDSDTLMLRASEGGITGEARDRITREDVESCA